MNEDMNTPMSPEPTPAGVAGWFSTWITAVAKPNEQTFLEIANHPEASPSKAYLWVFLTSLVNYFIIIIVQLVFSGIGGGQDYGIQSILGGSILALLCIIPIGGGLAVLGFMITTGLVQWIAGLFKGEGTFNQLAYARGAIAAPVTLVSSVVSIFSAIPFLGFCLWPMSILLYLYSAVLNIMAVKGINKFGWGQAIASYLLPTVVLFGLCLLPIFVIAVMRLLGPQIGDTFSSINNGL